MILTSPLARAEETCLLAGFADVAERRDELQEWDYGAYEGLTAADIRTERPGWTIWADGVPEGETADDVGARADRILAELQTRLGDGDAAVFAPGHLLRVLAARWLDLAPSDGRLLALDTASISILGFEREAKVIRLWNDSRAAEAPPVG